MQVPSTDASQVTPAHAVCEGTYPLLEDDTVDFHYNCFTSSESYFLKHVRNWSYDTLEREVRANLVYRAFTRMGDEKVPECQDEEL